MINLIIKSKSSNIDYTWSWFSYIEIILKFTKMTSIWYDDNLFNTISTHLTCLIC